VYCTNCDRLSVCLSLFFNSRHTQLKITVNNVCYQLVSTKDATQKSAMNVKRHAPSSDGKWVKRGTGSDVTWRNVIFCIVFSCMNKAMQANQTQFSEQLTATNVLQQNPSSEANISEISGFHFGLKSRRAVAFRQCCISRDWYRVCTVQFLTSSTAKGLHEQAPALWVSCPAPTKQH
jgi:hypothetical protein